MTSIPRSAVPPGRAAAAPVTTLAQDEAGRLLVGALETYLGPHGAARVLVVSGSYGAGHDAAAAEIVSRLTAAGCVVRRSDVADMLPLGSGRLLRRAYLAQLKSVPSSWGTVLHQLRPGTWLHRLAGTLIGLAAPALLEEVRGGTDLVISTHPIACQALGRLRADGRLGIPAVTYLTDASVHALWVHAGVDLHLGLHDVATAQARALGGAATTIAPLVPRPDAALGDAWATRVAAARAGLTADHLAPFVLVTGGSEGIGELTSSAEDVLATGLGTPVVVCGHNEALRRHLSQRPGIVALGWRDDLPEIIEAVDCVVQNAGGFSAWQALATGTPVLTYRPIPGHGVTNAAALERAGLVPWARSAADLAGHLELLLGRAVAGEPTLLELAG